MNIIKNVPYPQLNRLNLAATGISLFASTLSLNAQAATTPRVCEVKSFGAKGDGKTKDTASIQAAIDSCSATGGTVELKDGVFISGMITLKSNIDFKIDTDATLKGSQDDADYPDTHPATTNGQLINCNKTLIYAESAANLRIIGAGTIDGSGSNPKWVQKNRQDRWRFLSFCLTTSPSKMSA